MLQTMFNWHAGYLLVILSAVSVTLTSSILALVQNIDLAVPGAERKEGRAYSFEGEDFPYSLPMKLGGLVEMTVEESVHYSLTKPEARDEWLYNSPAGTGLVRLGPDHRTFVVSMFHQLHCLRNFHEAFINGTGDGPRRHVQHCLNLLRQEALCQADLTLEPGDFMSRNFTEDRLGATHICRDWAEVYDELDANWIEWRRFQKSSGNVPPAV